MQHAGAFIATGKTVLEAGTQQAQQHLSIFADQAKKAADATVSAVQSATQPKGPTPPPPPPGSTATPGSTPPGTSTANRTNAPSASAPSSR